MTATNSGRPCIRRRVSWAWNHPPSTVLINPIIPCQTHKQQLSSPRHTLSPWLIHGSCRAREEHGYGSWRCPSHPASCQGHTRKLWALPHQGVLTQETNVSTRRHLQVPLSWKVPVSPCPWACPMGRGGWLEGTWGSRAAPQKRPEGGRNSGGSWGGGVSHCRAAGFLTGRGHGGPGVSRGERLLESLPLRLGHTYRTFAFCRPRPAAVPDSSDGARHHATEVK